ncbi:response regulator [Hymenobacter aerophilus]|uniref:response regulator n=1 Tax=Hymenobacter aerophilus TaxID=119644 RepID=UPI000A0147F7|nr:response regulator transcription factor [Hymenobacter aerophilus]
MIRVFLVDDHTVLRHGMRILLANRPGLCVVGEAGSGPDLFEQLPTTPTDVVLLDIHLPGMGATAITRQLREQYPGVQVLVLSMEAGVERIAELLDAGARGYVLKTAGLDEVVYGIRTAADGRPFLSCDIGFAALARLRDGVSPPEAFAPEVAGKLSRRETEVL